MQSKRWIQCRGMTLRPCLSWDTRKWVLRRTTYDALPPAAMRWEEWVDLARRIVAQDVKARQAEYELSAAMGSAQAGEETT